MRNAQGLLAGCTLHVQPGFAVRIVFQMPIVMSEHGVQGQGHGLMFAHARFRERDGVAPREVKLQFMTLNGDFSQSPKNNLDTLWLER